MCRSWCHKGPYLNGFGRFWKDLSHCIATQSQSHRFYWEDLSYIDSPTHRDETQAFTSLPDANLNAKMALLGSIVPEQAEMFEGCNGLGHNDFLVKGINSRFFLGEALIFPRNLPK